MVQYAVSLRDPDVADQSQSNGFESDNDKDGNAVSPYTSVIFSNVSLYGPKVTPSTTVNSLYRRAAHIRRNNKMQIYNAVFAGWPTGLYIDGATTQANAIANDLKVRNSVIAGMTTSIDVPVSQTWDKAAAEAWYNTVSFKNAVLTANSDLGVTDAFNLTAPKFNLTAGSVLNTGSYWNAPTSIFSPKSASANSLKVYPNPATSQVIVELPEFNGFTTIQVTDLAGRNLINKTVSNVEKEILNISELRKGMYMIVARQGNTTYNQKLTVR
jgi:hypothetical protein